MVRRENCLPALKGVWGALCLLAASPRMGEGPCKICQYPVHSRTVREQKRSVIIRSRPGQRS